MYETQGLFVVELYNKHSTNIPTYSPAVLLLFVLDHNEMIIIMLLMLSRTISR